ncbi:hypothetical protein PQ472_07970 [Lacticaseibacillus pabuli]|uniref:Uncharacterized protein n=1 Tax=Lacticaseibacillus pabuli TaxID=3025672 RepID=A0ABY7WS99_9LACO|nr:hypothetical protein [Lacticaseibacillus sp. KACC 23028]WDF81862.1 hypothetical protein PQ472_07970 [Lacticaseibacillus sp. KACC 23028]
MAALYDATVFGLLLAVCGMVTLLMLKLAPQSFKRWLDKVFWNDEPLFATKGGDKNE